MNKSSINYSPTLPKVHHKVSKKRIYVTRVTGYQVLLNKAPSDELQAVSADIYYATCDITTGRVDWETSVIYRSEDLIGVDNVYVFIPPKVEQVA